MAEPAPDTRQRLLETAIGEFARGGFDGATVREICRLADASVNAVNYHFGDKQQLYVEAVKAAHEKIRNVPGVDLVDQIAERFEGAPEQRLRAFVGGVVAMSMAVRNESDPNHQLLFREMSAPTIATEHIVREVVEPQFQQLLRILEAMLPDDSDPIDVRLLATSIFGQCLHYKFAAPVIALLLTKREQKQLTVDRVTDHICEVVMAAVEHWAAARADSNSSDGRSTTPNPRA